MNQPVLSRKNNEGPIRTLIVDDSAFLRFSLKKYLCEYTDIEITGTARNGLEALRQVERLDPDVVTLDIEMPEMDGLKALRKIMETSPRPVVMLSSLTKEGAGETIRALTLGAVDFVAKPASKSDLASIMDEVATKIRLAAQASIRVPCSAKQPVPLERTEKETILQPRSLGAVDPVVCIGTSTGGPRALNSVIPALDSSISAAYVVIQHMPVGFTKSLAERLDTLSSLQVKEAAQGDLLQSGRVLIAPGGFHTEFDTDGRVALSMKPPVHGVRPAVDVTMSSLATHFGGRCVAVIMTGMGRDGTNGAALVRSAGGRVLAEDEATCVVWGMPRSVVEAGIADEVVRLETIPDAIGSMIRELVHSSIQSV